MNNSSTNGNVSDVWSRICTDLQQVISPDAVNRWFRPLQPVALEGDTLTLKAENTIFTYWIEENYLPQLQTTAQRVIGREVRVSFANDEVATITPDTSGQVSDEETEDQPTDSNDDEPQRIKAKPIEQRPNLNQRNTFDTFVVGVNNQFAHAAAMAVGQRPARAYNPLFLHGSVGLGKTHLMQAVGHLVFQKKKHLRVLYVTCEQFTNEFINALQHGKLVQFRKSYRQVDVLLVDDIQFLAGKDRSQDEFFHTFNALYDGSKQVVMTADSPPNEISNIEKRLASRFEWGLTADLQPPDFETRLAIIKHKMEQMPENLTDQVLRFIAENIKSNVRRLEGALTRAAAFASLHGRGITVQQVEVLLKDMLQQEEHKAVSIDTIQRKVAETYDIRLAEMLGKRRPANIALPRMVAMYLCRRLTSSSLSEIGEAFGGRDHGTVLHAQRQIQKRMDKEDKLRQVVNYLADKLGKGG